MSYQSVWIAIKFIMKMINNSVGGADQRGWHSSFGHDYTCKS